ncbi:glycoside hydrolase family 5 protein [Mycena olivaceomarginata]|nr:glycoside hydrolase family 5 protein [Mycena olivaceomarginata]
MSTGGSFSNHGCCPKNAGHGRPAMSSWFNQTDVDALVAAGINTVRIPIYNRTQLGYWIIEALVDRTTEFYPRGGLDQLSPFFSLGHFLINFQGVASDRTLTGCTQTDANYHRALIWTSVMTTLSHVDPAFANAVAIEAVNEPIMDASQTPGYGDFQKNFVKVVRATEFLLGVPTPGFGTVPAPANGNFTAMLPNVDGSLFTDDVRSVLKDAFPILLRLGVVGLSKKKTQLVTNFMDVNWQWNSPSNPADAAIGPHLRLRQPFILCGVADANPDAYMTSICNLNRVQNDAVLGNSPFWFGEWGLPVQFNTTDDFLKQWTDAQKLAYGQGAGWIIIQKFWNFKVEISDLAGDLAREWSYLEGVRRGYLTKDPSKYNDPNVCAPYIIHPSASASASASATI